MLRVGLFAITLLIANTANGNYLCVSEAATGFNYNEQTKRWEITKFTPDKKYLLSNKDGKWTWKIFGPAISSGSAAALSGITFTVAVVPSK
jgi:hypothetical protein